MDATINAAHESPPIQDAVRRVDIATLVVEAARGRGADLNAGDAALMRELALRDQQAGGLRFVVSQWANRLALSRRALGRQLSRLAAAGVIVLETSSHETHVLLPCVRTRPPDGGGGDRDNLTRPPDGGGGDRDNLTRPPDGGGGDRDNLTRPPDGGGGDRDNLTRPPDGGGGDRDNLTRPPDGGGGDRDNLTRPPEGRDKLSQPTTDRQTDRQSQSVSLDPEPARTDELSVQMSRSRLLAFRPAKPDHISPQALELALASFVAETLPDIRPWPRTVNFRSPKGVSLFWAAWCKNNPLEQFEARVAAKARAAHLERIERQRRRDEKLAWKREEAERQAHEARPEIQSWRRALKAVREVVGTDAIALYGATVSAPAADDTVTITTTAHGSALAERHTDRITSAMMPFRIVFSIAGDRQAAHDD